MSGISVIIPVYKAEKQIARCIDSIIAQTFTDWELLLVDDGSPDRSGEICDEYAMKDDRILVIHKENGGVSSARNAGLDMAKGEWIVFVDSDDWCEINYLSDFFGVEMKLRANDVVLQGRKDDVGGVVSTLSLKDCIYDNIAIGMLENDLLTFGAPYCKLYSNHLVQEKKIRFPETYSYGEDTTFFLKVLSVTQRIITSSKCNYHYVDAVEGSLSKKDHEYEQIKKFLIDSMVLVMRIDTNSCAHRRLVDTYSHNFISLMLRSIANMYRLSYSYRQKKMCFNDIKKQLLPLVSTSTSLPVQILKYSPSELLVLLFNVIVSLRK